VRAECRQENIKNVKQQKGKDSETRRAVDCPCPLSRAAAIPQYARRSVNQSSHCSLPPIVLAAAKSDGEWN
jgi:hypothetical protein